MGSRSLVCPITLWVGGWGVVGGILDILVAGMEVGMFLGTVGGYRRKWGLEETCHQGRRCRPHLQQSESLVK